MNNLKDFVNYLNTLNNGASIDELRGKLDNDDVTLKQFIKSGIDSGLIIKDGKKRGTRYYAHGKNVNAQEENQYAELEHNNVECYLNSNTPIVGQAVVTNVAKFGKSNGSLSEFLQSGITVESIYIKYDNSIKKNVIFKICKNVICNKIRIGKNNGLFEFSKHNAHLNIIESESFKLYEELREYIRAMIS